MRTAGTAAARWTALAAMILMGALATGRAAEFPSRVGDTNVEIGDRLRISSRVMRVDAVNRTLLISEKEVHLLDHTIGGHTLKTRLLDEEGKAVAFESFHEGQTVLVLGYAAADGHVYAIKIKRLDPNAPVHKPASRQAVNLQRAKTRNGTPAP